MENFAKDRTKNYLSQMQGSVLYKAIAMGSSFYAVPLMIKYLGQEIYGVWSTLLTVMSWLVFFDLGVGNGVRNKVAEALAVNDKDKARDYIATGYGILGLIAAIFLPIVLVLTYCVSWQSIFNTNILSENTLRVAVQVTFTFIVLNFWLGIINSIAGAVQKSGMVAFGQMISNVIILVLVYALMKNADVSIVYIALTYGLAITFANATLALWFFRVYRDMRTFPRIVRKYVRSLLGFGLQFFVIQFAVLVIFATDKLLITQLLGPEYVAQYDVATKLFGIVIFSHSVVSAPLWSAYTDAFQRNDIQWIKSMLKKQHLVFLLAAGMVLVLWAAFDFVLKIWIGNGVRVSDQLVLFVAIFTVVSVWNNIYAMVSNGIGKIRLQMYTAITAMLLNIPLAFLFVNVFNFGISGIVLSNIVCLLFGGVALPIQIYRMLKFPISVEE